MLAYILYGLIGLIVFLKIMKLLAKSKATFDLETDRKQYNEGDTIALNVKFKAKKPLESARVFVELKCMSTTRGNQNKKRCLYEQAYELEAAANIAANSERAWSVSIPIPRDLLETNRNAMLEEVAELNNESAEALAKFTNNKFVKGFNELQYQFATEWYLRATCECSGLDISEKLELKVS